jgi:hypothetical protein
VAAAAEAVRGRRKQEGDEGGRVRQQYQRYEQRQRDEDDDGNGRQQPIFDCSLVICEQQLEKKPAFPRSTTHHPFSWLSLPTRIFSSSGSLSPSNQ